MASYQQLNYCKKCKKNVSLNEKGQCISCGSTQIKKSWTVRFRITDLNGEKQKRLTGFTTKKEAEKAYIDFKTSYIPSKAPENNKYIFEDLLHNYFISAKIENDDSTSYDKRHIFAQYITPYFKGKDVRNITKVELHDWQNKLWTTKSEKTKKQLAWSYLTKIRGYLFNFLEYCRTLHDIPNPLRNIKIPKDKEIKKSMRFWELETFYKFVSVIDHPMWKTLWYTFMFTGARFNEIRALMVDDIQGDTIYITKAMPGKKVSENRNIPKTTKNSKQVIKKVPDALLEQLHKYFAWRKENNIKGSFLFGGDLPLSEGNIRRNLTYNISKANVKYLNPHGFRHSYVSVLINLGVSTKVVAELIGDTEIQVIKTYGHLYTDAKDKAIMLLNNKINTFCA